MNKNEQSMYEKFKQFSKRKLNKKFIHACRDGKLEEVKYLLKSEELKVVVDIWSGFMKACINKHLEIVQYLIFERNIEKTKNIQEFLEKNRDENIEKIFLARELDNKLQHNSSIKSGNMARNKL